jgi:glycosyltransferase involved in cell wall biosynthesis
MQKPITISVFFPTYNEEENIKESVEKALRVLEDSPYVSDFEIIIVNDGSRDNTEKVAEKLVAKHTKVRLISHPQNQGYGAALKTGLHAARMEYVFFTDADLQFDLLELQNLLLHVPENEVVVGYRAPRRDPAMRLFNAWGWNRLNRLFFGLQLTDIDCAFKLFRREVVQSMPLRSKGAMLSAELLIRLKRAGVKLKEIPVSHFPRVYGSPTGAKPSVILRALREMVELYRGDLGSANQKQVLRFISVGVLNTALDAVAYIMLTRFTGVFAEHLVAAKFFSFLLGTVSSLLINRSWTFGVQGRLSLFEVARFYATVSIAILMNVAVMNALVGAGMYDLLALAITTIVTFGFNFVLSKFWVFRNRTENERGTEFVRL